MNLLTLNPVPAAVVAAVSGLVKLNGSPRNLTVQAYFTYGSAGTSVDVWVQTSLDSGATWTDIANFHFTTAGARKAINLNAQTPQTTEVALTDGTMSANTAQDGILGPQFRAKYTVVGTYVGSTLAVDVQSDQLPVYP
jgi:hypothetical protein